MPITHEQAVETIQSIVPGVDTAIISQLLVKNGGHMERTIDQLLNGGPPRATISLPPSSAAPSQPRLSASSSSSSSSSFAQPRTQPASVPLSASSSSSSSFASPMPVHPSQAKALAASKSPNKSPSKSSRSSLPPHQLADDFLRPPSYFRSLAGRPEFKSPAVSSSDVHLSFVDISSPSLPQDPQYLEDERLARELMNEEDREEFVRRLRRRHGESAHGTNNRPATAEEIAAASKGRSAMAKLQRQQEARAKAAKKIAELRKEQEAAAEKERRRAEKEAEKERRRAEKEAKKRAKEQKRDQVEGH